MNKGTITSSLVVLASATCMASAEITLEVVPVDNSSDANLTGFVTQDLVVTTDTDWLSAQLAVTLDEPDQIFQDPLLSRPWWEYPIFQIWPPPWSFFDTYVSNGVLGEVISVTGAVDLGGPPGEIFDTDQLSIAWYTTNEDDIGTLALARVSLADTANGTWQFIATAAPQGAPRVDVPAGIVENGVMYIPEPATLSLLTLGGLALMRRRRK